MIVTPCEYEVFIEFSKGKDIPKSVYDYINDNNLFLGVTDVGLNISGFYTESSANDIGEKLEVMLNET